jgi:hypothetical protein
MAPLMYQARNRGSFQPMRVVRASVPAPTPNRLMPIIHHRRWRAPADLRQCRYRTNAKARASSDVTMGR